ncbi:MAG: hypothetical protein PHY28_03010 [Dehalococcoidales bacterium]|nr:hypothetical protein [Dehalococcoidales bacterium]
MRKSKFAMKLVMIIALGLVVLFSGCKTQPAPTTTTTVYSLTQLEYLLFSDFPNIFWCDPDYYPVAREGQEQQNAINQLSAIRSNQAEFSAILEHLNLPNKSDYTDAEKLLIYKEHKKSTYAIQITSTTNSSYDFVLRIREGQGETIWINYTTSGMRKQTRREPSINTCPICLTKGTLIATPAGQIPVEQLTRDMTVWTVDCFGNRVAVKISETSSTPVPSDFKFIRVQLSDGRSVTASPGHPTAEGRAISDYKVGDKLDGAGVMKTEYLPFDNWATYDILPSGATGLYWANGILLKSTLKKD